MGQRARIGKHLHWPNARALPASLAPNGEPACPVPSVSIRLALIVVSLRVMAIVVAGGLTHALIILAAWIVICAAREGR